MIYESKHLFQAVHYKYACLMDSGSCPFEMVLRMVPIIFRLLLDDMGLGFFTFQKILEVLMYTSTYVFFKFMLRKKRNKD